MINSQQSDGGVEVDVTVQDILQARERIQQGVALTPCIESPVLSELFGCRIYCKQEYLHPTGSFKERGARNALEQLDAVKRKRGVIAASAGNHALALAYHARELSIPATVVMPRFAPMVKQGRCRFLGANVLLSGDNIAEAKIAADKLVASEGFTYIHGFDGAEVIAGQGTVALEILEQVPDVDAVIVPVGGGGLIAGMGLVMKAMKPTAEVIGVEPGRAASFAAALKAKAPIQIEMSPTLADGLAVPMVGPRAFELASKSVDRVVQVVEEDISLAILRLLEVQKGVVEGAGATPLAALISGQLRDLRGKKVVLVLCGGNIDPAVLGRVIDYGLVVDGRLTQFSVEISDRPGGLNDLTSAIASTGASIQQVTHERAFGGADISRVQVICRVETRDAAHIAQLHEVLAARGMRVITKKSPWSRD